MVLAPAAVGMGSRKVEEGKRGGKRNDVRARNWAWDLPNVNIWLHMPKSK